MRHIAIVGSGPAGFYTAEAALLQFGQNVGITIIDRLSTPYGLIRTGVAPDHQAVKAVTGRYADIARDPRVRFVGNVSIGQDISLAELRELFDDVILATGAPRDRKLDIPGADLPGVIGSAAFVGWYNGDPGHQDIAPKLDGHRAVVIGNGNVALDCARILSRTPERLSGSDIAAHALTELEKSAITDIHIIGRRGPHQARFGLKEVTELATLRRITPIVDPRIFPPEETDRGLEPGQKRMVEVLRRYAAHGADFSRATKLHFDFFRRPLRIIGDTRAEAIEMMHTYIDFDGNLKDSGRTQTLPCDLVITAIGYRAEPMPGVSYDDQLGCFPSNDGQIEPGLWCVGWARRGGAGPIGANRPDGFHIVERIAASESPPVDARPGFAGLSARLAERNIAASDFADWEMIDAAEIAAARSGAPREKIVDPASMRQLLVREHGAEANKPNQTA